jgi:hypothetical protein
LGIEAVAPRLAWRIETDAPNWMQTAYEVECQRANGQRETVRHESAQSVLVDAI